MILHSPLTRREVDVGRLLAQGLTVRQIADELRLSRKTVRNHMKRAALKLPIEQLGPRDALLIWSWWTFVREGKSTLVDQDGVA